MARRRRPRAGRGKRKVQSRQISYQGMRDSPDPTSADPRKASYLYNVYPSPESAQGAVEGRPGYTQLGGAIGGGGRVQLLKQFSRLNGDEYTIAIAGGQFYTYDWATDSWTETITATDFANAGITLDATARVSAVHFADQMIFTDGVNTPWMWDGTTLTSLTNAPVAYGPPTVYYGKLFFIKDAERSTIVWSEENQPNTGYEAGGFNNAWTLGQTDQEALYRIYGTNNALFYWRDRSMGAIAGRVTEDFQTTGTHDALSQKVGTRAPWSVEFYGNSFFFIDSDGHPQRFMVGGGFQEPPIWNDARETTSRLAAADFGKYGGIYRPMLHVIVLPFVPVGSDENDHALVYNPDTGQFLGVWEYATPLVETAVVKDSNNDPVTVHGTAAGTVFKHGDPEGTLWDDDGVKIVHTIHGSPMMWDARDEKYFARMDASFRLESDLTEIGFSFVTPECSETGLNPGTLTGAFAVWDEAIWDTDEWPPESVESHIAVGFGCRGRWIQPKLSHDTLGERFAFLGWSVMAYLTGRDPNIG